ncbi:UDP-N-acetyl-D-glucosamine dehydrogenase [Candidatus Brocadia pituitae]|nr:UDP-N-acetyl-D-glucosamine dehydrogenase [Candidatus Brocadia pituitae]
MRSGYSVAGIDKKRECVESLNKIMSYVVDVKSEDIAQFIEKGILCVTQDVSALSALDAVSICVSTP